MSKDTNTKNNKSIVFAYIKATLASLIITFAGIIIFAFLIKWFSFPDSIIPPVNLAIKAISVFLGSILLCKGRNNGILKGTLFATLYTLISFSIFSILANNLILGAGLITDFAFNIIVGALGGILGVNLRKNNK